MIKKLTIVIILIGMLTYAQTPSVGAYISSLNTTGIDKDIITHLGQLITQKEQSLAQAKIQQDKQAAQYPVYFADETLTPEYINQQFARSLQQLLSLEQFKQLFLPQLESNIQKNVQTKWVEAMSRYVLTSEQEKKFKALLYTNTQHEVAVRQYYNYDRDLSWNSWKEAKLQSASKERVLIESFGQLYIKDAKMQNLVSQLQFIKIEHTRIQFIIQAIQIEQEKQDQREKTWRNSDAINPIYFYDESNTEHAIRMELREQLGKLLTIEQFKVVFYPQLRDWIAHDAAKEYYELQQNYKLTQDQYTILLQMLVEKHTEKIVTAEYYKYNWDLSQQKLRAVEFRHNRAIKEVLDKFKESK